MTQYVIVFTILILNLSSVAQNISLNENKYWTYRERLLNNFMIGIGAEAGQSIPATVRDTSNGMLQWTDCTIHHGLYMSVLATEFKILSANNTSTANTVKELFYALYALNRLDYSAEKFFGGNNSLNGFFIRDDIHEDSLNMDTVLLYLNQGLDFYAIDTLDSDFMDEIPRNNEESLDQAILLITGLGLISKYVADDIVYVENGNVMQFQDFETSISREARNCIVRIVNYMKEGDSVTVNLDINDSNLYGIDGVNWDFEIKNPVTYEKVMRGSNAFYLSYGFTAAKYWLTGLGSPTDSTVLQDAALGIFTFFEGFISPNGEDFKVINVNAMANAWPDGVEPDNINNDYNAQILGPRSLEQYYEWIPMLHQLMFGGENYLVNELPPDSPYYDDPKSYYEDLLDSAPLEGPYNYGDSLYPHYEWSTGSRAIQPDNRGVTNPNTPGNYNGLDYMLYYNMFEILYLLPSGVIDKKKYPAKIYPNPSNGIIYLDNIDITVGVSVKLFSLQGACLFHREYGNGVRFAIEIGDMDSGIYILEVVSDERTISTHKLYIR